ncbi:MAG TPA: SDR family NAD(P)-dependent oxidoreductase [Solirubrobacteraceae bacterium]|nr:SDR family NAD(P)-dependent oxidoreductase [Solirubrobacteraceae bacterium]
MTGPAISVAELERWLTSAVGDRCGFAYDEVDVERPLTDYGLSSRDAVELAGRLEDLLERTLPSTLVWDHPTIRRLASALVAQRPVDRRTGPDRRTGEPVAVVGLGCRLPGDVTGPEDFWRLLAGGADAVGELPADRWPAPQNAADAAALERTTRAGGFLRDIAGFDAAFFGISPREARRIDPQQRMVLEVGWEALEHAGISPASLAGSSTGVFVGLSAGEYGSRSLAQVGDVDAWSGTGGALSVAANRLSYALDLRGPSVAVDTACSSSLVAVHLGIQSLQAGESDLVLAAGANLLLGPAVTAAFHEMGVISPTGRCQPFSASADGIVRAEGAGVVVLKRLSDAVRDRDRVLAVLRGSAVNQDGRSNGITAPNVDAQEDLLRLAYASARLDPGDVDYVEAHGTGTLLGDPIEARALGAVLGAGRDESGPLLVGSVKSNLGHLEAAAGIVGLIKLVLAIGRRRIPASLHYADRHPHIDFAGLGLSVAHRATDWPAAGRPARAGVSAFGFGGTNAHVVVEEAPRVDPPGVDWDRERIGRYVLAGPDAARVGDSAERLADWLEDDGSTARLCDVEFTLARRLSGRARAGIVARDRASLIAGLRACAAGDRASNLVEGRAGGVDAAPVWVFSGHGSQWAGMGRGLMRDEPAFAAALDELDALIRPETGFSVCEELERGGELSAMERLQPVLFAIQVALSRLLGVHGVEPAAVVGHSVGEVAAAVAAGGLSARDGARVVALRSRLLATLAGSGSMAVLELSTDELSLALGRYDAVEVAAFNAPRQVVVAGASAQIGQLIASVESRGRLAKLVKSEVPGHSMLVDPVVDTLTDGLHGLSPRTAQTRFYSTALDDPRAVPVFDSAYWAANIRRPVRFAQAIAAAVADGHRSFIEISPHPVLIHALIDNARAAGVEHPVVLSTGRRSEDETAQFHAQLTTLRLNGAALPDVEQGDCRLIDLPRTRWRHTRHWLEPATPPAPVAAHPLLGERIELPGDAGRVWRSELDPSDQDGRWMALSTWLEIAHSAATDALRGRGARVEVHDLELGEPLALGDRCTLMTSLEPTAPRSGRLAVHSRLGSGAWRTHLTAVVETSVEPAPADPAKLEAPMHVLLAAAAAADDDDDAGTAPRVLAEALDALVSSLGPAGDGAWLGRSVGRARWLGGLDEVAFASISVTDGDGADQRTAMLQLADAAGHVRLELSDVMLSRRPGSALPVALSDKLLSLEWQSAATPRAARVGGRWLIVGESSDPRAGELADRLRSGGADARIVDGQGAEREVRGDRTSDGVVLMATPARPGADAEDTPGRGEQLVLDGARIVRALSERPTVGATPTRLWFVTSGAAAVVPGDQPDPGPAALRGLVRVLAFEHPELQPRWVDLDPDRGIDGLVRELGTEDREDEVAWRGGRRHVARLIRPELGRHAPKPVVEADGSYLVSGGLGGLGLLLARWLAEAGAARVLLNGRSAPTPRAERELADLRRLGCDLVVVNGDIAAPGVAERAVAACAAPGARFRGVIHAAAVIEDRVTLRLDAESLHRVWSAKAAGGWRLSAATSDFELDWWVGFSSAAALIGSPGQAAYAAANAYLDALTASRRARGMVASTINWGTWAQVGQAADRVVEAVSQITPAEGLEAIQALLATGMPAAGVLKLDPSAVAGSFPALAGIPLLSGLLDAAATPGQEASTVWSGVLDLDPVEASRLIEARVTMRVAEVLGADAGRLDAEAPLTTLGLDSLLAMRIRNAIKHDFDVLLPPSLLLRGASITDVLGWLGETLRLPQALPEESDPQPRPTVATPQVRLARVAPRDASERIVHAVWAEVLGTTGFGVTQSFDELGGSQPEALRAAELLGRRTGHPLLASDLFEHPTIERQATLLRERETTLDTPLRLLRAGGPSTLFMFHPGGGDTLVYRQLVDRLDPSLTVWGFDRLPGALSVEQRAERYVELLRETQRHGPYQLAGWSFGGALAYETALRLHAVGERVELLAMIDTILPLPDPPGRSDAAVLELRFRRFADFLEHNYGKPVALPYERMARLGDEAQTDAMIEAIVDAGLVDPVANAAIISHQRTSYLDVRALERYRPAHHDGPVTLYSAQDVQTGGMRDARFDRQDPSRGWDPVCGDQLDIVSIPGHHLSLLDPPHVETLATHLAWLLSELRRAAA